MGVCIYSHSSTNPENMTKISQVNFEVIALTGIVKKNNNIEAKHKLQTCYPQPGRINNHRY